MNTAAEAMLRAGGIEKKVEPEPEEKIKIR
jgi:hypothetical protein